MTTPRPDLVGPAAEKLAEAAYAMSEALADHTFTDEHYTTYIDAVEELIKACIASEGGNSRLLAILLHAAADEVDNY